MPAPADLFQAAAPVSLEAMNDRASLQRRTDHKYLVPVEKLAALVDDLAGHHEVLDIDGERVFRYESVYFDTEALGCFRDHVQDRRPRYKIRTRCYVTTGACFFEVKVKDEDGETTKRHVDYDPDKRDRVTEEGQELLEAVLDEFGLEVPAGHSQSLVTAFERVTLVHRERPERTTFDFDVTLRAPSGGSVRLDPKYAIAETKTEEGDGAWDRAFSDAGLAPVSLSKYRLGTGVLYSPDEDPDYARDLKGYFGATAAASR